MTRLQNVQKSSPRLWLQTCLYRLWPLAAGCQLLHSFAIVLNRYCSIIITWHGSCLH